MRRLLILIFCCFALPACAQQEMEVIPLKHRTVDQLIPALRPLVEPGGALSGMNNQLILRASRANREQIRQALAALDTPQRSLLIRVNQNRDAESRQLGGELSGNAAFGSNVRIVQPSGGTLQGGSRIEMQRGDSRVDDTRSTRDARSSQVVQVVEGGRAFIQVGQSLPLPLRQVQLGPNGVLLTESIVYRDVGQGFYAIPQLSGDRVTLEISPQFDTPGSAGSVNTQRLSTSVSGRLGEWIELGGSGEQAAAYERGNAGVGTNELRDRRSVWLLVEALR